MAGRRSQVTSSGPPVVCAKCRIPFRMSAVVDHGTKPSGPKIKLCARCTKDVKAAKKRKKQENNPT